MSSKSTSSESALNQSQIDGTEIFRASKKVNGEWLNYKVLFSAFKNWIAVQLQVITGKSVTGNGTTSTPIELVNDEESPTANKVYGTDANALKHYYQPPVPLIDNGIISGGEVTWIANYDYEVAAAVYAIRGVVYTSPLTSITLSPSDAVLDRLDTFILDTSGVASALTGTPSATPIEPDVDITTQLRIAFAFIDNNTTAPTLPTEDIYLENTEWVTADNTANIDLASTNFPYAGTVDIEGTAVANGNFITFTPATFPSLILLDSFVFKIRSKAAWNAASRLVFQFQNGTTNVGNAVNFGNLSYGFVSATTGAYQNINIPLTDFGNIAAATRLRILKTGTGTIGFYLDNIQLVGNNNVIVTPQVQPDWASGTSPAAILNKSVTRTVAQMQALATGGFLDPNMWYVISDVQSSFGVLRIRARDASNLETSGTLIKSGVAYKAGYDLTSNEITSVRDEKLNNFIEDPSGYGNNCINNFPYNNANFDANNGTAFNLTVSDASLCVMSDCIIRFSSVTLDDDGAAFTYLLNTQIYHGSVVSVIHDSTLLDCIINYGATVTVDDTTTLTRCTIGNTITIALNNETYTNKKIDANESTFNKSRTIAGDGAFDFDNAGYDESFVGIWTVDAVAPRNVTSFINSNFTHVRTFRLGAGSSTITFVDDGANVIMKGSANAVLTTEGDYVTFRFVVNVAYEIDRGIY